jgi:hypothetical protein
MVTLPDHEARGATRLAVAATQVSDEGLEALRGRACESSTLDLVAFGIEPPER